MPLVLARPPLRLLFLLATASSLLLYLALSRSLSCLGLAFLDSIAVVLKLRDSSVRLLGLSATPAAPRQCLCIAACLPVCAACARCCCLSRLAAATRLGPCTHSALLAGATANW